jgi:cell division protein FtsI (penicillin-binding protein 3)
MISRWTRVRVALCGFVLLGLCALVGRRALELQVEQAEELKGRAEDQYLQQIELRPQRGRILDRHEHELASTAQFDSVSCNPRQLLAIDGGVKRLAQALGMDARALRRSLEGKRFFAWVKHTVPAEESARVKALGLPGVELRKEFKRVYPGGALGATVIGHANMDGRGIEGAELAFDERLRGSRSQTQGIRDGKGRALLLDGLGDPTLTAGKDVVLSLDRYLMYVTEQALADVVDKWKAKGGTSVMMDPNTGEILAMASVPTYDANDPGDAITRGARNRAITDMYEPGSTMKTITFAAAFDAGKLRTTDMFDCQMGNMQVGKYHVHDAHPMGILTAAEVFQHSSNIGTIKIARRIGKDALAEALGRFGFGRRTGLPLVGEQSGALRPVPKWGDIGFANIAFGQGLAVTALQITTAFAAIASGGIYHPPRLALRAVRSDGTVEELGPGPNERPEERIISAKAAATMLQIMPLVTQKGGSAPEAAIDGYLVGGKTGTAQKVSNGHYDKEKWISSFVGIVPADNPRVVIAVVIDEPRSDQAGHHYGGKVAGPVFKDIAEATMKYLSVPRSQAVAAKDKDGDKASGKPDAAAKPAAKHAVEAEPAVGFVEGPVSDQPAWEALEGLEGAGEVAVLGEDAGEEGTPGEAEEARPELVTLPSFTGLTVGQAIRVARRVGIEITPDGSGVAITQSPAPGPVPRGALCRVSFRPRG